MTLTPLEILYTAVMFFVLGLVVLWIAYGLLVQSEECLQRVRATRSETEDLAEQVGIRMRHETRRRAGD